MKTKTLENNVMVGWQPCNLLQEAHAESVKKITEERERLGYDPDEKARNEAWNALAKTPVGYTA